MSTTTAEAGRKGGKSRWKGTTKAQRSKAMRKLAKARWEAARKEHEFDVALSKSKPLANYMKTILHP